MKVVTVPFKDKLIVNYFDLCDENLKYIVDYKNSSLSNSKFITYLSNINIPIDVYIDESVSYTDKESLLLAWLECKNILPIDILSTTLIDIIFNVKSINGFKFKSIFSNEELIQFKSRNNDLIITLIDFLDNILFHCQVQYGFKEKEVAHNIIDSIDIIPKNISNIFMSPEFFVYYSKPVNTTITWYKRQFEGQNALVKYFYINKNPLTAFMSCIVKKTVSADGFLAFIQN